MKLLRFFLFFAVFITFQIAQAQSKALLQASSMPLEYVSQPTEVSLTQARQIFKNYKAQVDAEAVEVLPRGRIEENVLLYIHSFTQGPHEIESVKDILVQNNFNILALSFSGHELDQNGQRKMNFRDYDESDWKRDVQFALRLAKQYGKKVWLMGYSTGGLLALQQVKENSSRIQALILISPALALANSFSGSVCTGSFITNSLDISSDENQKILAGGCLIRNTITNVFETLPMLPSKDIETEQVLSAIHVPVFVAYTTRDETVDNWRTEMMKSQVSSPVTEYIFGENDHATHGDMMTEYNVNLEIKNYPGVTLKSALNLFLKN